MRAPASFEIVGPPSQPLAAESKPPDLPPGRTNMGGVWSCLCAYAVMLALLMFVPPCSSRTKEKLYNFTGHLIGILIVAIGTMSLRSNPPIKCLRFGLAGCIACSSIIIGAREYLLMMNDWNEWQSDPNNRDPHLANILSMGLVAAITLLCVLVDHPPSQPTRDAVHLLVSHWLCRLMHCLLALATSPSGRTKSVFRSVFFGATQNLDRLHWSWFAVLTVRRAMVLEQTIGKELQIWFAWWLIGADFVCTVVHEAFTSQNCLIPAYMNVWTKNDKVRRAVKLAFSLLLCRAFVIFFGRAWIEERGSKGPSRAQARWAKRVLLYELIVVLLLASITISWEWAKMYTVWPKNIPALKKLSALETTLRAFIIAYHSLWKHRQPEHKIQDQIMRRSHASPSHVAADWSEKVREIAGRGLTLDMLLDFYTCLLEGQVMPTFDIGESRTNDVVRQAVIPLSRHANGEGSALATVWNNGEPAFPQKMVTHNWDNKFEHLVAAVVADGIGVARFHEVTPFLTLAGVPVLKHKLGQRLRVTYWICAFSVNQHAGICGGFGPEPTEKSKWDAWDAKRRDTKTGCVYPVCSCVTQKYFYGTLCEMNKFDDMMAFVQSEVPGFTQVVAVDMNFDLFWRAWCQAELVEAATSGLPQTIKIHSEGALDKSYNKLVRLRIEDCQASREEDKEAILSKIDDKAMFNDMLQHLIFGSDGLFSEWLDAQKRVAAAARIAARLSQQ